jgi:restriction endonuclease Mrr
LSRRRFSPRRLIVVTKLATLTTVHNLGLSASRSYEVKRIDTDYFGEG